MTYVTTSCGCTIGLRDAPEASLNKVQIKALHKCKKESIVVAQDASYKGGKGRGKVKVQPCTRQKVRACLCLYIIF